MIRKSWRNNWGRIIPFFAYPDDIRKAIYTTNAIESLNNSLRKVTRSRNSFPSDDAAVKLLYMALRNIIKKWTMPIRNWSLAIHQFSIHFEGRIRLWIWQIISYRHNCVGMKARNRKREKTIYTKYLTMPSQKLRYSLTMYPALFIVILHGI